MPSPHPRHSPPCFPSAYWEFFCTSKPPKPNPYAPSTPTLHPRPILNMTCLPTKFKPQNPQSHPSRTSKPSPLFPLYTPSPFLKTHLFKSTTFHSSSFFKEILAPLCPFWRS
ncbi:hypothetical protein OIU78_001035 [Salix suchowensis]|nr:hypothetical protein OIU78_001035 [Salix suchowensis]